MDPGEPPPPLPPDLEAFKHLISSYGKRKGSPLTQTFIKKTEIPSVDLPIDRAHQTALNLMEQGIIGKFTGLWPSLKAIEGWVQRNWRPLVSKGIHNHFVGRGYYILVFDSTKD